MKCDVKIAKTLVKDAQNESVIPARLDRVANSPIVGLIEAVPNLSDRYHLHGASTLTCPNEEGEVTFRI